jgi:hypothetical protein
VVLLFVLSAIPIIHPLRFSWHGGVSDLAITGYLPPHGGERGIHVSDSPLGDSIRIRTLAIDFAFVAWEFVLSERLPANRV